MRIRLFFMTCLYEIFKTYAQFVLSPVVAKRVLNIRGYNFVIIESSVFLTFTKILSRSRITCYQNNCFLGQAVQKLENARFSQGAKLINFEGLCPEFISSCTHSPYTCILKYYQPSSNSLYHNIITRFYFIFDKRDVIRKSQIRRRINIQVRSFFLSFDLKLF